MPIHLIFSINMEQKMHYETEKFSIFYKFHEKICPFSIDTVTSSRKKFTKFSNCYFSFSKNYLKLEKKKKSCL